MNRIILVRHGEPDVHISEKIDGDEIPSFLENYNQAPLKSDSYPCEKLLDIVRHATVCCSTLPHSVDSARRCGVSPDLIDPIFCESIPPHFQSNLIRLRPKSWLLMSRMLWLVGFSLHGESLQKVRTRASKAARMLTDAAKERDVVLFGHGLFNIMIACALKEYGYAGPGVPARAFWEYGIYHPWQKG